MLQRQQGSYILTVEAGRQLLLSADSRAEVALQAELTEIQERWKHASICLDEQKKELATLLKVNQANCQQLVECRKPQETLNGYSNVLVCRWKFECFSFFFCFKIFHQEAQPLCTCSFNLWNTRKVIIEKYKNYHYFVVYMSDAAATIVFVMDRTGRGVREESVDRWRNFEPSNGSSPSLFLIITRTCRLSRCAAR